jgi:hypothetical protein
MSILIFLYVLSAIGCFIYCIKEGIVSVTSRNNKVTFFGLVRFVLGITVISLVPVLNVACSIQLFGDLVQWCSNESE